MLNRLPVELAKLGSHLGIGNQSERLLIEFLPAHLDGQKFAQYFHQRAFIDSRTREEVHYFFSQFSHMNPFPPGKAG
ncbi:hypothetical protein [Candidatus Binatus sp.]